MKFPWSFFDNFVTLSRKIEADSVQIATSQFFKLLGWFTSSDNKLLPVADSFKALGIEIDLVRWRDGVVLFQNTPKRIAELFEILSCALNSRRLGGPLAKGPDAVCKISDLGSVGKALFSRNNFACLRWW